MRSQITAGKKYGMGENNIQTRYFNAAYCVMHFNKQPTTRKDSRRLRSNRLNQSKNLSFDKGIWFKIYKQDEIKKIHLQPVF